MKNLFMTLTLCCLSNLVVGQQHPVPIPIGYSTPSTASLCLTNTSFSIDGLDISPISPISNFTLSMQVYVVTSNVPPLSPHPTNWPPDFPECFPGEIGIHPIEVLNSGISIGCSQPPTPVFIAETQTFDWYFNNCTSTYIDRIHYDFYLDCSIFNMLGSPNNSLYLIQKWYYKDLNGNMHLLPLQPLPVPIVYPNFSAPNFLSVSANFGNQEEWIFSYKNIGTASANVLFDFNIDNCSNYTLGTKEYFIGSTPPTSGWQILPPDPQFVIDVPVNEFIFIKQNVTINGCAANCGPLPPPASVPPVYARFSWRCNRDLPNDFCSKCHEQEYLTQLVFQAESPSYTIERLEPADDLAEFNYLGCQDDITPWKFKVKNTSNYAHFQEINVAFNKKKNQSLSLISDNSISITQSHCSGCVIKTNPPHLFVPPAALLACANSLTDPVSDFTITINDLAPGDEVIFEFDEYHCCSDDPGLFNSMKFFNQWEMVSSGTTSCPGTVFPTPLSGTYFGVQGSGIGGISGHAITNTADLDMQLSFSNPNTHTTVPQPLTPQLPYYKDSPENFSIDILESFGSEQDAQIMGYSLSPPATISGIIKVTFEIKNAGLILVNPYHAFFEITDPSQVVHIWSPMSTAIDAGQFPCDPSVYLTGDPCFYSPGNYPNQDPIPCAPSTYCLYFDTSQLPAGIDPFQVFQPTPADLISTGYESKFKFSLYACCTQDSPTDFDVSFSLLRNTANCTAGNISVDCGHDDCFLPLSKISGYKIVHCPGCKTPGVIVDNYRMERTSLGFPDPQNNRFADSSTPINYEPGISVIPYSYSKYDQLALNRSVYGDFLNDFTIAHFEDGAIGNPASGFQYCNMTDRNINLDVLQVYRDFPFSGMNDYNVIVTGFDFYIDDPNPGSGSCLDCDDFYFSPVADPTLLKLSVDASSPAFTTFFERLSPPQDDSKLLFTFTETDLNSLISDFLLNPGSLPAGVDLFIGTGVTNIDYDVWQKYRLRTYYKVCGNMHISANSPDEVDLIKTSAIVESMYLTGSAKNLTFILDNSGSSNLPLDNRGPESLQDLESNYGLMFSQQNANCQLPASTCTTCVLVNQMNLADPYYFICEPSGAEHEFFATDLVNKTYYLNNISSANCEKTIEVNSINSLKRKTSNVAHQIFKYEYKPLNLFPQTLTLIPPAGWMFKETSPGSGTAEINLSTKNMLTGFTNANVFNNVAFSGSTLEVNFENYSSFNCLTQSLPAPTSGLYIGDEFLHLRTRVNCVPVDDCPDAPAVGQATDSQILFSDTDANQNCRSIHAACGFSFTENNIDTDDPHTFNPPLPNLQMLIYPYSLDAVSKTLTWNFTANNISMGSTTTPVKNIYISVPDVSYLTDWEIAYSINSGAAISMTPDNNDYFWLVPAANLVDLPVNGTIQGQIKAKYDVCIVPAEPEFTWGWNCFKETMEGVEDADLCLETPSNHLISNKPAALTPNYDLQISSWPDFYTACDPAPVAIKACFQSIEPGELQPLMATIINHGNVTLVPNSMTASNCYPTSAVQYQVDPATGDITVLGSGSQPDGDFMQATDCFCIEFEVYVQCNFNNLQLPSLEIQWIDYCGTNSVTTFDFPPIPADPVVPSVCTDCFMVSKTANPISITSGSEPVTYTITVMGNNDPNISPTPSIDLWDNFPISPYVFTPIGNNPFGTGGPSNYVPVTITGTGFTTFDVTGTITLPPNSPPVTSVCNEAVIGNHSGPSIVQTATACVDVIPNCVDATTNYIVNPGDPFGSSDASSVFNCTSSPCNIISQNINVTGTLVLNGDFNFVNCNFIMEPGSEIIVQPSGQLFSMSTFRDCRLSECSKMWKGISLEKDAWLAIGGSSSGLSLIRGAQYAIKANDNNLIAASRTGFESNYVGIYIPDNGQPPANFNTSTLMVRECEFYGNANAPLPPHYSGQEELLGNPVFQLAQVPLAGIVTVKAPNIFLGHDDNNFAANSFKDMSNGIMSWRSYLGKIYNCKFENILPQPLYTSVTTNTNFSVNMNGSAIYANGNNTAFSINQKGFGNDPLNDPFTFKNCHYGIFADRITLTSDANIMQEMGTGYRAQLVKGDVKIYQNNIDALQDGIQLLHCDGSNNTIVWANDIVFGSSIPGAFYCGVRIDEPGSVTNNNSTVNYNRIHFRTGAALANTGIFSRGAVNFNITNNELTMSDNNYNLEGIFLESNIKPKVGCNYIYGAAPFGIQDQSGIKVFMGDGPEISCNHLFNTENGFYLQSPMTWAEIKGNEFNEHTYAYRFGSNALTVNDQHYKGNKWTEPANGTGLNARNENPNFVQFNVNSFTQPIMPFSQDPPNWFDFNVAPPGTVDFECNSPIDYCDSNFPADCPNCRVDKDEEIAKDSIFNYPYTEETRWMLKRGLVEKIENNPAEYTDSLMLAFYGNIQSNTLYGLKSIADEKTQLFAYDSLLQMNKENLLNQAGALYDSLNFKLDLLADAIENNYSIPGIATHIQSLTQDNSIIWAGLDSLMITAENAKVSVAENIRQGNFALNAAEQIELNERVVNDIYLSTIAKGVYEFTGSQTSALVNIAEQCPLSGGNSVIFARSLYAFIDYGKRYNDREICSMENIELKQAPPLIKRSVFTLHPNPASTTVTLSYSIAEESVVNMWLINAVGQSLQQFNFSGKQKYFEFSVENLNPGVYFVKAQPNNQKAEVFKLVIVK